MPRKPTQRPINRIPASLKLEMLSMRHAEGMCVREIARRTGVSWRTAWLYSTCRRTEG